MARNCVELGQAWDERRITDGRKRGTRVFSVQAQLRLLRTAVQGAEVQNNCAGDSNQVGEREYVDE